MGSEKQGVGSREQGVGSPLRGKRIGRKVVFVLGGFGVAWFAVQAGQFSMFDLFRLSREQRKVSRSIDSLTRVVDSLQRYRHQIETDPALQERLAREVFGMVRGNEVLIRFVDSIPDNTAKRP